MAGGEVTQGAGQRPDGKRSPLVVFPPSLSVRTRAEIRKVLLWLWCSRPPRYTYREAVVVHLNVLPLSSIRQSGNTCPSPSIFAGGGKIDEMEG